MTIITALNDGQETWLGYNDGDTLGDTPIATSKQAWLKFEDWAFGSSGEAIQQDVLEYNVEKMSGAGSEPFRLVEKMRNLFQEYNHYVDKGKHAGPSYKIWGILAHKNGSIWDIGSDLALTKIPANTLWARGSGTDYALGAANALREYSLTPEEQITKATQAAIDCDLYCHGAAKVFKF